MQDIINSLIESDLKLKHMEEFHPQPGDLSAYWYKTLEAGEADNYKMFDWRINPSAVLPQWISLSAEK